MDETVKASALSTSWDPDELFGLFDSPIHSDVTIHYGERSLKAHKFILRMESSYMRDILEKAGAANVDTIVLEDDEPVAIHVMVSFMYRGHETSGHPFSIETPFPFLDIPDCKRYLDLEDHMEEDEETEDEDGESADSDTTTSDVGNLDIMQMTGDLPSDEDSDDEDFEMEYSDDRHYADDADDEEADDEEAYEEEVDDEEVDDEEVGEEEVDEEEYDEEADGEEDDDEAEDDDDETADDEADINVLPVDGVDNDAVLCQKARVPDLKTGEHIALKRARFFVRLFVIANKYGVKKLELFVRTHFIAVLESFPDKLGYPLMMDQIARYIYLEYPDHAKGLREYVVDYLKDVGSRVKDQIGWKVLLMSVPELSFDLVQSLVKKLEDLNAKHGNVENGSH